MTQVQVQPQALSASQVLCDFVHRLELKDIPQDVLTRAKHCMLDTLGVSAFGSQFPWSQAVLRYAKAYAQGGQGHQSHQGTAVSVNASPRHARSQLLGVAHTRLQAPLAALVNGAFAHAFEMDSLRKPGAGVHPGATLLPAALALAQEVGASGETLLKAFIAATEVMFRIGAASLHSSEKLGFHAPGLTGPYGAAMASGVILGLNAIELVHALGIAGSLSGGLLAFTQSQQGAEVKRLHLGRAGESGVMAARLAQEGFEGPETILEGKFGFLHSFCAQSDPHLLTHRLGESWETRNICMKAYPCHVTAHPAIDTLRELMRIGHFTATDISHCQLEVGEKILSHHDIRAPQDIKQGQYSVPFCVALAMHKDPSDPAVFNDLVVHDERVLASCQSIRMIPFADSAQRSAWASRVSLTLRDGSVWSREADTFKGAPERALSEPQVCERFLKNTAHLSQPPQAQIWMQAFLNLESMPHLMDLGDLA
jgi:2-methylcitrate dehydratase PrpD